MDALYINIVIVYVKYAIYNTYVLCISILLAVYLMAELIQTVIPTNTVSV